MSITLLARVSPGDINVSSASDTIGEIIGTFWTTESKEVSSHPCSVQILHTG